MYLWTELFVGRDGAVGSLLDHMKSWTCSDSSWWCPKGVPWNQKILFHLKWCEQLCWQSPCLQIHNVHLSMKDARRVVMKPV